MIRGSVVPGWRPPVQDQAKKETYAAAIEQQAGDYDEIMGRYRRFADSGLDGNLSRLADLYRRQLNDKAT